MDNIIILFLAADPTDASRLRLGQEAREIREQLQLSEHRERFEIEERWSVRAKDVSQAMLQIKPNIVHFSGHGTAEGEICFENVAGNLQPANPSALSDLFGEFSEQIKVVILNACYSERQARAIADKIGYVIGMSTAISDRASIAFSTGFYQALGAGKNVPDAYKFGVTQIGLSGIDESEKPKLLVGCQEGMVTDAAKQEAPQTSAKNDKDKPKPDELEYFVNQVDVIKYITSTHSPAYHLIDAPAGFGKTTLMKELQFRFEEGGWLCCYVSIQHPKTSAAVISDIARQFNVPLGETVSGKNLAGALMKQYGQKFGAGFQNGVAVFIDIEKPLPSDLGIVDALLDEFIPDTADALRELKFFQERYNPFRVVIASRYLTGKLARHPKVNPVPHTLAPFSYKTILEAVNKHLPDQPIVRNEPLTAHLMYYTGGHPGCISRALALYKKQNCPEPNAFFNDFESEIWEIVSPEIGNVRESIDKELRRVFDDLCVFRFFDSGILRDLTYLDEFNNEFDLQDKLRGTYLLDPLFGGPFLRDGITRKLISLQQLNDKGKNHFAFKCNQAQNICKIRLENPTTQMPHKWLIEYLYQYLQQYIADIQNPDTRRKIRERFFQTIIPEGFALFAKSRNPREYRISIEGTLNEDWELQFTVNYFLRTDQFDDSSVNSPWAATKQQMLDLFK